MKNCTFHAFKSKQENFIGIVLGKLTISNLLFAKFFILPRLVIKRLLEDYRTPSISQPRSKRYKGKQPLPIAVNPIRMFISNFLRTRRPLFDVERSENIREIAKHLRILYEIKSSERPNYFAG